MQTRPTGGSPVNRLSNCTFSYAITPTRTILPVVHTYACNLKHRSWTHRTKMRTEYRKGTDRIRGFGKDSRKSGFFRNDRYSARRKEERGVGKFFARLNTANLLLLGFLIDANW